MMELKRMYQVAGEDLSTGIYFGTREQAGKTNRSYLSRERLRGSHRCFASRVEIHAEFLLHPPVHKETHTFD